MAAPVSFTLFFRGSLASTLEFPLALSQNAGRLLLDLVQFRKNADENRFLRKKLAQSRFYDFQKEELLLENKRLTRILSLKPAIPPSSRAFVCRVIARSPSAWNRVILIDKGRKEGIRPQMPVLSNLSLVGKVVEAGPSVSKVLLITDPNFRAGVGVQGTREQGILLGTLSGECRVKYLSGDTQAKPGDQVATAGLGGFFPKGLPVGAIERIVKEPGQAYRTAHVKPFADLGRLEEVLCVG